MRHLRAVLASAVLGVLATGGLAVALADTAPSSGAVTFGAETWYEPNPTCKIPVEGCLPISLPAVNPYGAGTLHVADTAGQETARAYLAMTTPADYQDITGGTLTIPLDTSTQAGSAAPDTSKVQVCLDLVGGITANEGEFDAPPATDCTGGVVLTYSATPTPELTGDLAPMAADLREDFAFGSLALGLVPDDTAATATWHVAFASNDAQNPATAPASLTLTYGDTSATASASATTGATGATAAATTSAGTKSTGTTKTTATTAPAGGSSTGTGSAAAAPPADVPPGASIPSAAAPVGTEPSAAAPQVAAPEQAAAPAPADAAPVALTRTVTVGFAYPGVLLLPLALILLGFALARVMTRPVGPPRR